MTFSTSTGPVPGPEEHGDVGRWDLFQYLLRGSSTNGSPILSTYEDCKSDDPPHPHHVSKNRGVEGPATPSFCTGRPVGRGRTDEGGGGGVPKVSVGQMLHVKVSLKCTFFAPHSFSHPRLLGRRTRFTVAANALSR